MRTSRAQSARPYTLQSSTAFIESMKILKKKVKTLKEQLEIQKDVN